MSPLRGLTGFRQRETKITIYFFLFGVSCSAEIDIYDRGTKFVPDGLFCSPCWKKRCPYDLECVQTIDLEGIYRKALEITATFK